MDSDIKSDDGQLPRPADFKLRDQVIGTGLSPFVIAEISGNHGGKIENAYALIAAAKRAGASAVKFQTYEADTITINSDKPDFVVDTALWRGRTLYDLYCEAQTPFAWHEDLFKCAASEGIIAFSAPFDHTAVDLLERLNCPLYKIASCELVDIPLIKRVAQTGKPIIMSSGMASFDEIAEALTAARSFGERDIVLLHCVSGYPTDVADANLASIIKLREKFGVHVGLSDHSKGTIVAACATALGASVIEKHICLSRVDGTVDSDFSLTPDEFKELVKSCQTAHSTFGKPVDGALTAEADSLRFRRSLYVVADMKTGEQFTPENMRSIRPSAGIHTRYYEGVLGKTATIDIAAGTALDWDMIDAQVKP